MVGVTMKTAKDAEILAARRPLVAAMLKEREEHARNLDHDYSHAFRARTRWELARLSAIAMAIEFAYAAETSFVSPILLQIGVDHRHMTMAWGLSPLIGFFVSPLLGSLSDRCRLRWGRRRPVITVLSLGIVAGLILVPWGKQLGVLLGDGGSVPVGSSSSSITNITYGVDEFNPMVTPTAAANSGLPYAVILTIVGMVLLDFDADTCQTPARTYLLDMCTAEDQPRALTTFTLFAGIGGTIGYAIGAVNWETTQIGNFLGGNIPTVFILVTIIFIVCYLVTVTTFREIPLSLLERDVLLRPLTAATVEQELQKNNNAIYYIKEANAELQSQMAANGTIEQTQTATVANARSNDGYQNGYGIGIERSTLEEGRRRGAMPIVTPDKPASLAQYLKSIFIMPYSMRMLALTNLLCWMGHVTYCLYFTDFVGEAVFGGDPTAPPDSIAAQHYEMGVRFGCWGMSIYAISCSVYSMVVGKLMSWLGTKTVYISGILYYSISMLILGLWPTKWGVLFFSTSAGILYGTVFTLPYILVANYHSKNCFRVQNGENIPLRQTRGLGTDVAIISSMVFIAQLVVALFMGPLVAWMQTTCAVLYASTVLTFLAAIAALYVLYI